MQSFIQKSLLVAGVSMLVFTSAHAGERYPQHTYQQSHNRYDNHHRDYRRPERYRHETRRSHHKNDDHKLFAGLLVGALLGYAILDSQNTARRELPPQQRNVPQPAVSVEPRPTQCLQQREYTMKVVINGQLVDAYGTACLQPDGSWKQGPLNLPDGLRF